MKPEKDSSDNGISDVVGTILIIFLVIGLAAIIAAFLMPNLLPKSVYIASEVGAVEVPQPGGLQAQVLYMLPKAGEPFHLAGQQNPQGGANVLMKAVAPDGRILTPVPKGVSGNPYGQTLYIYPNNTPGSGPCDCIVSPALPPGALRLMTNGVWTVQLIDLDASILVMSNSDGKITDGETGLPRAGGTVGGNMYRADCSVLNVTTYGNPPILYNATMNMSYRTFNGAQYLEYANDPTLTYTGNMAISMWLDPSDTTSWHTIIGKGILYPNSTEYDNYQLVAIGNVLYFEWNNADGTHYHSQTNLPALTQDTWQYVTVNVQQNGQPQFYVNGQPQASTVYTGNVPNQGSVSTATVNLQDNNYPVKVGKQNSDQYPFYFTGAIGNTAIYNRALTQQEISQNYQNYWA